MPRDNGRGGEARGGRPFRSLSPQFAAYLRHYWLVNSPSSEIGAGEGPKNLAQSKFPLTQNNATRGARAMVRRGGSMLGWDFASGSDRLVASSPSTSGENLGKNMTVGCWVRPNNIGATLGIFVVKSKWNGASNFYLYTPNGGASPKARFGFHSGGGANFRVAESVSAIPLVFPATLVVGTYDGVEVKIYLDGKLEATTATTDTPDTNVINIAVGSDEDGNAGCAGDYAHVFIMNRALHQGEIMRLAQMGPDAFLIPDVLYPPLGPPPPAATPYRGWGSLPTPISQTNSGLHGPVIFPGTGPLDGVYH